MLEIANLMDRQRLTDVYEQSKRDFLYINPANVCSVRGFRGRTPTGERYMTSISFNSDEEVLTSTSLVDVRDAIENHGKPDAPKTNVETTVIERDGKLAKNPIRFLSAARFKIWEKEVRVDLFAFTFKAAMRIAEGRNHHHLLIPSATNPGGAWELAVRWKTKEDGTCGRWKIRKDAKVLIYREITGIQI